MAGPYICASCGKTMWSLVELVESWRDGKTYCTSCDPDRAATTVTPPIPPTYTRSDGDVTRIPQHAPVPPATAVPAPASKPSAVKRASTPPPTGRCGMCQKKDVEVILYGGRVLCSTCLIRTAPIPELGQCRICGVEGAEITTDDGAAFCVACSQRRATAKFDELKQFLQAHMAVGTSPVRSWAQGPVAFGTTYVPEQRGARRVAALAFGVVSRVHRLGIHMRPGLGIVHEPGDGSPGHAVDLGRRWLYVLWILPVFPQGLCVVDRYEGHIVSTREWDIRQLLDFDADVYSTRTGRSLSIGSRRHWRVPIMTGAALAVVGALLADGFGPQFRAVGLATGWLSAMIAWNMYVAIRCRSLLS